MRDRARARLARRGACRRLTPPASPATLTPRGPDADEDSCAWRRSRRRIWSSCGTAGIDCFFANAGTDFASIVDAFARFAAEGQDDPRPIAVPHEFVAVSMAHGYYLVTGRPQAVMVHVDGRDGERPRRA